MSFINSEQQQIVTETLIFGYKNKKKSN